MNRREFVKFLGCLAAGTSALPAQVEAFTKYYDTNTPQGSGPFVAIDEVFMSGMASHNTPVYAKLYHQDEVVLPFGINLFGGILLWRAGPDQKIVGLRDDFLWLLEPRSSSPMALSDVVGQISYIDSNGVRRRRQIDALLGRL
jgi:hypothetical protein